MKLPEQQVFAPQELVAALSAICNALREPSPPARAAAATVRVDPAPEPTPVRPQDTLVGTLHAILAAQARHPNGIARELGSR